MTPPFDLRDDGTERTELAEGIDQTGERNGLQRRMTDDKFSQLSYSSTHSRLTPSGSVQRHCLRANWQTSRFRVARFASDPVGPNGCAFVTRPHGSCGDRRPVSGAGPKTSSRYSALDAE